MFIVQTMEANNEFKGNKYTVSGKRGHSILGITDVISDVIKNAVYRRRRTFNKSLSKRKT